MKQSVLCLNVINQHYLYFYLLAEGDIVTFTSDSLFIYFSPALINFNEKTTANYGGPQVQSKNLI